MQLRRLACLGVAGMLLLADTGCRRWRDREPPAYPNGDPFYGRRDGYPPGYPPYPPAPGSANFGAGADVGGPGFGAGAGAGVGAGPEVLTPQPYPQPGPAPGMPPTSSGYLPYPGGVRSADYSAVAPPVNSIRTSAEPPLARPTPFAPPKPVPVGTLPPDLLDLKPGDSRLIPPTKGVEAPPLAPVGIAGFLEVKERVATGRKPDTDGLDWLKANKYRTVLHLRPLGANDSADREQVVKRDMKYLSMEISSATLTKELFEEFGKIVANESNHPLFVYDRDGTFTGAMWYLNLRLADKVPDAVAKSRAELFGLKSEGSDEQKAVWAAAQRLLDEKK